MSERSVLTGPAARERTVIRLTRPLREFLETEIAGGIVLLAAVVAALVWANSPWRGSYEAVWHIPARLSVGGVALEEDLRHWVNDGLMVLFFFVVGLEIKRELVHGELGTARKALLPTVAALGGMVVPALLYLALNTGGVAARGWGIPMATDIALALGVLALLGRGLPSALRVLLLSLAIVDDVGAILIIAIFYTDALSLGALAVAVALLGVVVVLRKMGVWWVPAYVMVGTGVWLATLLSGIHATIAGVALGLLTPAHPLKPWETDVTQPDGPTDREEAPVDAAHAHDRVRQIEASEPVAERLQHALHPWTSYLVLPVFALANAGVPLGLAQVRGSLSSTVTLGIVVGLVAGKMLGISGAAWLATRLGAGLPQGTTARHVVGLSALAGIGFTMSLFISSLAFGGSELTDEAKVGILAGSVLAASVAAVILRGPRARTG